MSNAFYDIESLRFYSEDEIEMREMMTARFASVVKRSLQSVNRAWSFTRVEGPILTPRNVVGDAYDESDIFVTQIKKAGQHLVLRPETTKSSYAAAIPMLSKNGTKEFLKKNLPLCVWQVGKSFRVEKSDGATAAKLRFNEFYQQEFQCIYSVGTLADYRAIVLHDIKLEMLRFFPSNVLRVVDSDRLPSYSESTIDIEVKHGDEWREVASCSIRTDFHEECRVFELAIGLDRLVEIYTHWNEEFPR